ncbi:MAG TPA: tetratricopeptide repeat-containing glycosyltransferase family protein, partial [Casimicrobiaceae bacterium]
MALLRRPRVQPTGARGASSALETAEREATAAGTNLARQVQVIEEVEALTAQGRFGEALTRVAEALAATPEDGELLCARASILQRWGRLHEARAGYSRAEASGFQSTTLCVELGWTRFFTGDVPGAEACMRRAVALDPESGGAHFSLAATLSAQGRYDEAVEVGKRGLELSPDDYDALVMIAGCELKLGETGKGEPFLRRASTVAGDRPRAWTDLGGVLASEGRQGEALEALRTAAELEVKAGEEVGAAINLARYLLDLGRVREALAQLEQILCTTPDSYAHLCYSFALLTVGRLREGWHHHEFRWLIEPARSRRPAFPVPVWSGQDLRGKTILLRGEQGYGNIIQLLRYAPLVKALGASVVLQVRQGLDRLCAGVEGVDRVITFEQALPAFDYYIHLHTLPTVFETDLDSIPADIPYIRLDSAWVGRWAGRVGAAGELKVGLVWAGNPSHRYDRDRSIPQPLLDPLWDVKGVRFYSLQKGSAAAAAQAAVPERGLVDLGPDLEDFADTAAVIAQLDLVIGVDTAVVHLAGALGKPVWLLVANPAEWRWLEERVDSPWYPTLRLFRQREHGAWPEVIERVRVALEQRVRSGEAPARRAEPV